ncbi:MAG TPA: hypothetical protein PKE45_16780 [Caldilineaceae bacterium]|nr:hypothetical protein [Caldilineaceae bacterium]
MSLAFWRDISVIWLSLLCFIGLIVPLTTIYFAVRGMNRAHMATLSGLRRAQGYSRTIRQGSEELSQRIATPVIKTQRQPTRLQTTLRRLWPGQDSSRNV